MLHQSVSSRDDSLTVHDSKNTLHYGPRSIILDHSIRHRFATSRGGRARDVDCARRERAMLASVRRNARAMLARASLGGLARARGDDARAIVDGGRARGRVDARDGERRVDGRARVGRRAGV